MQIKSNAKKEQLSVNDNNKINLEAERKKVKLYINAAGVNTNELTLGTTINDFAKIYNTNDKDNKMNLEIETKNLQLYIKATNTSTNELTLGTTISDFAKICNTNDKDNNKVINNKHKNPTR